VDHVPAVQRPPAQCGKLGCLSKFHIANFHETDVYIGLSASDRHSSKLAMVSTATTSSPKETCPRYGRRTGLDGKTTLSSSCRQSETI
jgi:hypothetical protein